MPSRKRTASTSFETPEQRRRSVRISSSEKKSLYFESDPDDDDEDTGRYKGQGLDKKKRLSKVARRKSAEEEQDVYEDQDGSEDEGSEVGGDEEDSEVPTRRGKNHKEEQIGEDEDDDEDGDPKVTFIPHAKMRGSGGVEYQDDRLHQNTLLFLKDLKANNKRSWLKAHDEEFRRSLDDWKTFVESTTQRIIEVDDTIPELPLKDIIFRIYRDIRFSKDPTPYKAHYSAAWSRTGKKGPYACYYVHCEPGNSFIGGGLWHPEAAHLALLRASIDERPRRWRRALMDENFRRTFFPKAKGTEAAILKAFAEGNRENALKTKPKGFIAEHRDIELLKLRNFTVSKKIPDSYFTAADSPEQIAAIVDAMRGFITHLNGIVMPDPDMDDDSDDDGDEE